MALPMKNVAVSLTAAGLALAPATALAARPVSPDATTTRPANVSVDDNPYLPTTGHPYRHGAVNTRELNTRANKWTAQQKAAGRVKTTQNAKQLAYGGSVDGIGVTHGAPKVYLVVYGSQWGTSGTDSAGNMTLTGDKNGTVPLLQRMFKGLGTGGEQWSGVMTQYCDGGGMVRGATTCSSTAAHVGYPTGGAFAGIWYDSSVASPSAATGNQLAAEAVKAAGHFGNTTAAQNRNVQYVVLSPSGTHPDGFNTSSGQFCAWHSWNGDSSLSGGGATPSAYGDVAFTNFPYVIDMGSSCGTNFVNSGTSGVTDGVTMVEGHEYAETITDQNPGGGWYNLTGSSYNGQENADECAWISPGTAGGAANVSTANGSYAMQATWSNDTQTCAISHPTVG